MSARAGMDRANHITREQASAWLTDLLRRHFEITPEQIRPDADIYRDLDLDSIDAADIVLKFNETFGRSIDIRAFREVRTLAQALELLGC